MLMCLRYPGLRCLLVRRTLPELRSNHLQPLLAEYGEILTWCERDRTLTLDNGSTITLGYSAAERDALRYQGQEYDVIALDEATQLSEYQFSIFKACLRGTRDCPRRMYLTCNPGGVGHQWVKRLFVDKNYTGREIPENYNFIPALVYDNKAFLESDPEYVAVLEALPEKRRKAMLYGDWNAIEGAFFDEFMNNPDGYKTRINTHVIDPFDIPDHWQIYRSYDHGFSRPYSTGYWTVSPDGTIFRIAELYGCTGTANEGVKQAPQDIFRTMKEFESSHPHLKDRRIIGGVADPSIWNASSGKSVAEHAAEHGIYFSRGDNKRVAGWMEVRSRLAVDNNGRPSMYIFSNCKAAIRTIPLMMYAQHGDPEDLDTDMEDHVCDEIRYFCMSRPMKSRVPKAQTINYSDPLMADKNTIRSWKDGVI